MAGDWIPWVKGLTMRNEVRLIAATSGRDRRWVASVMMELWELADSESTDGFIPAVPEAATLAALIPDTQGEFWSTVATVGWIIFRNGGVQIPKFDRWLGNSAKKRLQEAVKKRKQRSEAPKVSPKTGDKNGDTSTVLSSPVLFSEENEGFGEKGECAYSEKAAEISQHWCFRYKGNAHAHHDPKCIAATFQEWMDKLGIAPEALLAEVDRKERECSEAPWDMKRRLVVGAAGYSGLQEFVRRGAANGGSH